MGAISRAVTGTTNLWLTHSHPVAVGVLSGLIVGLPLGMLNRLFQRISAIMGDEPVSFSMVGTLGIVIVTVLPFAIPAGVVYVAIRPRLPRGRAAHGAAYGLLLLTLLGVPYIWSAPMGMNTTGDLWINRLMYGSLFVLAGLALPPVVAWVERRLPVTSGRVGYVVDGALVLLGVVGCVLLLLGLMLLAFVSLSQAV